jgi:asparagine synthetase B (glutamine-hydrolysing)
MCGIAVAINWPEAGNVVARLIGGILHRGDVSDPILRPKPDTAMATRRLRIVDAEHGAQPQLSFDGQLAVSFNGEIYNHEELRVELMGLGVPFRTESDTEVLANALQVWGLRALERLNGMYAFVALDLSTGEFLAARSVRCQATLRHPGRAEFRVLLGDEAAARYDRGASGDAAAAGLRAVAQDLRPFQVAGLSVEQ